jgi:hypothetical protein
MSSWVTMMSCSGRVRRLYELGDLDRPEYIARRDAIHAELDTLAPEPTANLDQAGKVLEDFAIFWAIETDPAAKRQFLSLVFGGVWLDHDRVRVAVQPKPSFLPFFEREPPRTRARGGKRRERRGSNPRLSPHPSRYDYRAPDWPDSSAEDGQEACAWPAQPRICRYQLFSGSLARTQA